MKENLKERIVVILNETPQDQEMDKLLELFEQKRQRYIDEIKEIGFPVHRLKEVVGYFLSLKNLEEIFKDDQGTKENI